MSLCAEAFTAFKESLSNPKNVCPNIFVLLVYVLICVQTIVIAILISNRVLALNLLTDKMPTLQFNTAIMEAIFCH